MASPKFNSGSAAPLNTAANVGVAPANPIVTSSTTGSNATTVNNAGLEPGTYKFTIKTVDHFGGVTYHNCYVKVVPSLNTTTAVTGVLSNQLGSLNSGSFEKAFPEMLGATSDLGK